MQQLTRHSRKEGLMPLVKGNSQETVSKNITDLSRANTGKSKPRSHDQIIAIALSLARKKKK